MFSCPLNWNQFSLILFFTVIQATAGSFIMFLTMADCVGPSDPTFLVDTCLGTLIGRKTNGSRDHQDRQSEEEDLNDVTEATNRTKEVVAAVY